MHGTPQGRPPASTDRELPYLGWQLSGEPDLLDLHSRFPERYPILLESAAQGSNGRFDVLLALPGDRLELAGDGVVRRNGEPVGGGFLDALQRDMEGAAETSPADARLAALPFHSGWFVFLAYELVQEIEPGLAARMAQPEVPLGLALRIPAALIRDHIERTTWLVGEAEVLDHLSLQLKSDLLGATPDYDQAIDSVVLDEDEAEEFLAGVDAVKRWIHEGDVFQVNLSRAWRARVPRPLNPASIYRRLRKTNPAPFACLARLNDNTTIISSSPERLVAVRGGTVTTRPIAGTYPRAGVARDDERLARELLSHPKERAEHVMLIDLERNDLGRICDPGSVRLNEFMTVESYAHVHHIVSDVGGRLRSGMGPVDVIRAVFPGGTITGCPKVRCMEIIAELEGTARGAYTGSLGYINRDGSMDLNILIRTLVQHGMSVQVRAGAGLVADSDPHRELAETRTKATGVLRALAKG